MKHKFTPTLIAIGAAAVLTAAPALAKDDCHVPMARWQPRAAVLQAASDRGWRVERLKIDDGCYEIRGTDASGNRIKAKLDPETLEMVKFKRRKDERKRDQKERRKDRSRQERMQQNPDSGPGSTPSSSLITPGGAVRGQIS